MFLFIRAACAWNCSAIIEITLAMICEVVAPEKNNVMCVVIAY